MKLAARSFVPAALLLAMAGLMWHSASVESQTYDEAIHLAAGYSYWRTGDFRLNPEHPPLTKLLQAAPLLALGPALPESSEAWKKGDAVEIGRLFVHHNRIPATKLLGWGRAVTMALALLLGAAVFWWTRSAAGTLAATLALGLYALDPNFIAHGHYITSDVPAALAIFAAAVTWLRYLDTGTRRDFWFAALALGLAATTKFSALYLLPVHIGIAVARHQHWSIWSVAKRLAAITAVALGVVALSYGPATARAFLVNPRKPLATLRDNHPYVLGLKSVAAHNGFQQPAYLLGDVYTGGRWQYFPVAFLVKTPAAALLAFLAIPFLVRRRLALFAYPAAYFAIAMATDINLGHRHILPVYPFLYGLTGIALAQLRRHRTAVIGALAAVAVFETARIHPDHIAFFNAFAGGPDNGSNLLLDSNLDWGQDLGKLKTFLASQGTGTVALKYFGSAEPADYGIQAKGLPPDWDPGSIARLDGWAAISMTLLHDVYYDKPAYTWLRAKKPTARMGRSILVYDLRRR